MKRNPRDIIVRPLITEKTIQMQDADNKKRPKPQQLRANIKVRVTT